MAEVPGYINPADTQESSSSSTVPVPAPVVDLTDSDDAGTTDNLNNITPGNFSEETKSISSDKSDSLDDSFSIVYENITPVPEVHIVDFAGDLAKLVEEGSESCGTQVSSRRKVKIGSKSMNISISISTKNVDSSSRRETSSNTSTEKTDDDSISVIEKPKEKFKISCGICLDAADEITASERKLIATVCGHIFCCQCFDKSMEVSKLCPKCRKRLGKKQFHPIYL